MKLNTFLIILFILLKQISAKCYEPVDVLKNPNKVKEVDCDEMINEIPIDDHNNLVGGDEQMFQVNFKCLENDVELCNKVERSFENAGKIIATTLTLKKPIMVNATFLDFCQGSLVCPERNIIGAAGATRYYSLLDDDGLERLYPQALVKQFDFQVHPKYNDFDIETFFNAAVPFYFSDDKVPISPKIFHFDYIIIHELVHGLGFSSAWGPYPLYDPPIALWPQIVAIDSGPNGDIDPASNESVTVKEAIFDKFMIRLDNGSHISEYTKQIAKFFLDNINVTEELNPEEFEKIYQFQLMKEMLRLGTTPKSLGFLPHNANDYKTDAFILETSIPIYNPGSSISHSDLLTYNNTSDFLMVFRATPGRTLDDFVRIGGNYSGGVIGPKLKSVLESIGYATQEYPDPHKPQPFVPGQEPAPTSNSGPTPIPKMANSAISNFAIFNQFYVMTLIIIILLQVLN